jgi:hypothetical protein
VTFRRDAKVPGRHRVAIRLTRLPLTPPFAGAVEVTLTHHATRIDRSGAIATCETTGTGLRCR